MGAAYIWLRRAQNPLRRSRAKEWGEPFGPPGVLSVAGIFGHCVHGCCGSVGGIVTGGLDLGFFGC